MRGQRAYPVGLVLVAAAGVALVFLLPGRIDAKLTAVLVALAVQGPLGWWLIRSVGTPDFLRVWVIGILARFLLLGVMALAVFRMFEWPLSPGLLVHGGMLMALLFVEGLAVWLKTRHGTLNTEH